MFHGKLYCHSDATASRYRFDKIATMVITLVNYKFYVESGDKDDKRNIKHIAKDICSTVQ